MTKWIQSAVVFFCVLLSVTASAANFPAAPNPFRYVNDYTNRLTANEKQQLETKLVAYSQETSSQIAVVLVATTGEYDIAQYAFELGDKWGIGRKQLNNGVLMLIAVNDRKIFIATGQGLEGVLPDAFLSQTIRNKITPQFKQGNYARGISNGLDEIIAASKGEFDPAQQAQNDMGEYIPFIMIAIFVLIVILGEIRWRNAPYISPTNNHNGQILRRQSTIGRRSNRGIGGGFGDGGFGGGSGGGFGGGSFGGGSAGGSW